MNSVTRKLNELIKLAHKLSTFDGRIRYVGIERERPVLLTQKPSTKGFYKIVGTKCYTVVGGKYTHHT